MIFARFAALWTVVLLAVGAVADGDDETETEEDAPFRILLLMGGANHDYGTHAEILRRGLEQHIDREIEWRVELDGSGRSDRRLSLLADEDWAGNVDLVIHHHCYPRVGEVDYVDRILAPHREGIPAVLIHGSLRSFCAAGKDAREKWSGLVGAAFSKEWHGESFRVRRHEAEHGIAAGMEAWQAREGQLYRWESLAEGARTILLAEFEDESGEASTEPLSWTHRYGPSNARVFVTSLGNRSSTLAEPAFLKSLSRGVLWTLDEDGEGAGFVDVEPEESLEGLSIPAATGTMTKLGPSAALTGRATALGENRDRNHLAAHAIDGDVRTFWEAGRVGPTSWWVDLPEPTRLSAVGILWEGALPPQYEIEVAAEAGGWGPLDARASEGGSSAGSDLLTLRRLAEPESIRRLRVTVPSTRPGQTIGIRELALYEEQSDVPASLMVDEEPEWPWVSVAASGWGKDIRLVAPWRLSEVGPLPRAADGSPLLPRDWFETAEGGVFLVHDDPGAIDDHASGSVLLGRPGGGGILWTTFLTGLPRGFTTLWDGEWLSVIHSGYLTRYRDSSGDGRADERMSSIPIDFPEEWGEAPQPRRARLGMDGRGYAILESDGSGETMSRLIRFRRDGTQVSELFSSPAPIAEFWILSPERIYARTSESGREPFRILPVHPSGDHERFRMKIELASSPEHIAGERIFFHQDEELFAAGMSGRGRGEILGNGVGRLPGLHSVSRVSETPLAILEDAGSGALRLIRLSPNEGEVVFVDLDRVPDGELPALLGSDRGVVRREAVHELHRRRRDPTALVLRGEGRLGKPGREAILCYLSRLPPEESLALLRARARTGNRNLAFVLLESHPAARNLEIYRGILEIEDPETTARILACLLRTTSEWEEIDDLVLDWTGHESPLLSGTAAGYLQRRGDRKTLAQALLDPERFRLALDNLMLRPEGENAELVLAALSEIDDRRRQREMIRSLAAWSVENPPGESGGSSTVETFLREALAAGRFEARFLLDVMTRHGIHPGPSRLLVDLARKNTELEPFALSALEREGELPGEVLPWLERIERSDSHDLVIRMRAFCLLCRAGEVEEDDAFDRLEDLLATEPEPGSEISSLLVEYWGRTARSRWGPEWLVRQARENASGDRRRIAWQALLEQRRIGSATEPSPPDEVAEAIGSGIDELVDEGGAPLDRILEHAGLALVESEAEEGEKVRLLLREVFLGRDPEGETAVESDATVEKRIVDLLPEMEEAEGDADLGWELFRRTGCGVCHNVHGEGERIGPDIVSFVRNSDAEMFLRSLFLTEERIQARYQAHRFELRNGRTLEGIPLERSAATIRLRDGAGNPFEVDRDRIHREWENAGSLMETKVLPEWTASELASLRAYLLGLSSP